MRSRDLELVMLSQWPHKTSIDGCLFDLCKMKLPPVILIDLEQISPEPDFVNMLICISNQQVLSQGDTRLKNMHGAVATHGQAGCF